MNVLVLAAVGLGGLVWVWLAQVVALRAVGHPRPYAWPLRHDSESGVVRWVMKGALQLALVALLLGVPWLTGEAPADYYAALLLPARWGLLAGTMGVTLALFVAALAVNLRLGWVKWSPQLSFGKSLAKVFRASLTPLPLALMEEAVFRGVIFEQLLRGLPETTAGKLFALTVSSAIFSAVHFLREQKKVLLPALGLFTLGFTLGLGYLLTGHTLWLPVACHAAGVWFIQLSRPFLSYPGPAWVIGYRSYPICGVLGFAIMWLLVGWAYVVA
jgi:hypothetical protein